MSVQFPTAYEIASLGSLRGEQQQFLTAAYNRGIAATASLEAMSASGIGVRATVGFAAYRAIAAMHQISVGINNTPLPLLVSPGLFTPTGKDIGVNYRLWGTVQATDNKTGGIVALRAVLGVDRLASRQVLLEGLAEKLAMA